jgi:hypothetical protein
VSVPHEDPQVELELALALLFERTSDPRAGATEIDAASRRAARAFEQWAATANGRDPALSQRVRGRIELLRGAVDAELRETGRRIELAVLAQRALASQTEPARSVAGCDHAG